MDQENSPTDYPEDSSIAPRMRSLSNADENMRIKGDMATVVPHLMAGTPRKVVHHHDDDDDSGASSSSDETGRGVRGDGVNNETV